MTQQPTLGWDAIGWIERWVVHGPGDVEGTPWSLDDEECRFVLRSYALNASGRRQHSEALYSRPKGRRKTDLVSAVGCFEALGPCRFERWGRGRNPVGRRVTFPFLRILATEEGQANSTAYATMRYQMERMAQAPEFSGLDVGLTRTFLPGGGEVRPSAANAASKDGGKESFVMAEESHLYITDDLRQMYATVRRNLTKRPLAEPWLCQVSTMFGPGQRSIAEATHAAAATGLPGLLLDHREGPMVDLDDDVALAGALREAYGEASSWVGIERIIADHFRDPRVDIADSIRYYLNRAERMAGSWLRPGVWEARTDALHVVLDGAAITLGFDGARTQDSTALVGCEISTGYVWPIAVWARPLDLGDDDEWEVPAAEVDAVVEATMNRYRVIRSYNDPPWWEIQVDTWAGRWPDRVWRFPTSRYARMVWAVRAIETAIRSGELTHDGSSILAEHIANARRRPTTVKDPDTLLPMHVLAKEFRGSRLKVDAAVALVLAWQARLDAIAAGALVEDPAEDYAAAGF